MSVLVGATSISCAVSLPISLNRSSLTVDNKSLNIRKCDSNDYSESISLGEEANSDICWRFNISKEGESPGEEVSRTQDESQLSEFFKSIWMNNLGTLHYGSWKNECIENGKGWKVKELNGSKIVGYCGNTDLSAQNTSFVGILKSESKTNVSVCLKGKDCWSDNFNSEIISEFETKDSGEWQEITFFKQ